jgi:hypothetical protein
MCEDDVVVADGTGGVCVGIARGFVVGRPVIVPVVVEEGVDGIGFEWESADDGNLEVGPRGWAPGRGWVHRLLRRSRLRKAS